MKKKIFNKHSFFFRTRDQFEAAQDYVKVPNDLSVNKYGMHRTSLFEPDHVGWYCQHRAAEMWKKVPKTKPGSKKYLVVVRIHKKLEPLLQEDFVEHFCSLGLVPVPKGNNKPKYTQDDITSVKYRVNSVAHFKQLTKLMNREYGHGQWHLRGHKKILRFEKCMATKLRVKINDALACP